MSRLVKTVLLLSILLAGSPGLSSVRAQPAVAPEPPPLKHPSLAELGKLYRDLELPLPPKGAGFAVMGKGWLPWEFTRIRSQYARSLQTDYQFRFATEDPQFKGQYLVWRRFQAKSEKHIEHFQQMAPSPEMVLQVMKMDRLDPFTGLHLAVGGQELIFAIQCHLLEHNELAAFFYRRCHKTARISLEYGLLIEAWNYWAREINHPAADRKVLATRLKLLVDRHDVLNLFSRKLYGWSPGDDDGIYKAHQSLLDQLDLTLKPTEAKPGSAKWLIDAMASESEPADSFADLNAGLDLWDRKDQIRYRRRLMSSAHSLKPVKLERKLAALGFEAIPVLIDHIDDLRFTRFYGFEGGGISGRPFQTVVAGDFPTIGKRARHVLSTFFDLSRDGGSSGWKTTKADYLVAWKAMSLMNESDFVAKKIATSKDLNGHFISFLKEKYYDQSINLYKNLLIEDYEAAYFPDLSFFIVDSRLPQSEKIDLLTKGLKHKSPLYQMYCLEGLLELDDVIFTEQFLELLSRFPKEFAKGEGSWHHVALVKLGLCSQDSSAREAVYSVAKKLPAPMKIALLAEVHDAKYRPKKNLTLSFMAQFLDDATVYQDEAIHHSSALSSAFQGFEKIEVRNYAADQILTALGIDLPLDDKTSKEQWAKVREFVQDEVERRLELEKVK